ncbi:MAG TPA: hypothetical protein VEA44_11250 [Caulobacter sp.]|nr:hypothetical protein [Caulobacter sp.]
MFTRILMAIAAVFVLAGVAGPAEARWLRAESQKFIVYSDGDEMTLRQFVSNLEDYDRILRQELRVPQDRDTSRKLEIYLVGRREALQVVRPGLPESIAGFYSASMYDIFAIAHRPQRGDAYADDVIYHEYAHHFMLHYLPRSYPGWYIEGFAEYYAPIELKDTTFIVGGVNQGRAHSLLNEKWIPMEDLLNKRPFEFKTADERSAYYAQAWLLTHYMNADPARKQQLIRYVAALGPGEKSSDVWTEVTGDSMATLTNKLQAYKKGNIVATGWKRVEKRRTAEMTIAPLPASADGMLLLRQRLMGPVSESEEASLLAEVRSQAARYPGDRLAELVLAQAEFKYGDFAKGRSLIDGLLAKDAADADALRIIGVALVDQAWKDPANDEKLFKEGRKFLARAYQADNDDYRTMVYFTLTQQGDPDYPDDNTLNVLAEAFVRAPQVADVRLMLARGLMRNKRWDEATALLTPLTNDPHGGGAASTAQGLLRQIAANR